MAFAQQQQIRNEFQLIMNNINHSLYRNNVQDTLEHLEQFVTKVESLPFGRHLDFTDGRNFHEVFSVLEGENLTKANELFDRLFKSISEIVFRGKHLNAYFMPRNICVQLIGPGFDEAATFPKEEQTLAGVLEITQLLIKED